MAASAPRSCGFAATCGCATCRRSPHACREHERVVPLFVFDPALLGGRFRSHARTAWMLGCLRRSTASCAPAAGGWCSATGARRPRCAGRGRGRRRAVHVSDDVTGFARARDAARERGARARRRALARHPGALRRRPAGDPHQRRAGRTRSSRPSCARGRPRSAAPVERAPREIAMPRASPRAAAVAARLGFDGPRRARDAAAPGEEAGRARGARLGRAAGPGALRRAPQRARRADLAPVGLPALRLPLAALARARASRGGVAPARYRDQLAWRDFFGAVPLHFPHVARVEFQERYRALEWDADERAARRRGARAAPASRVVDAGDAPARRHGLDAQPRAHDRRLVPDQGPPAGLARGRAPLHGPPARRRLPQQQRRLAVDRLDRHRPDAVLPAPFQPDDPAAPVRPRRALRAPLVPELARVPDDSSPSRGR